MFNVSDYIFPSLTIFCVAGNGTQSPHILWQALIHWATGTAPLLEFSYVHFSLFGNILCQLCSNIVKNSQNISSCEFTIIYHITYLTHYSNASCIYMYFLLLHCGRGPHLFYINDTGLSRSLCWWFCPSSHSLCLKDMIPMPAAFWVSLVSVHPWSWGVAQWPWGARLDCLF